MIQRCHFLLLRPGGNHHQGGGAVASLILRCQLRQEEEVRVRHSCGGSGGGVPLLPFGLLHRLLWLLIIFHHHSFHRHHFHSLYLHHYLITSIFLLSIMTFDFSDYATSSSSLPFPLRSPSTSPKLSQSLSAPSLSPTAPSPT